jgi:hypothetical protein
VQQREELLMELKYANEIDKQGGWTLSPAFLKQIQGQLNYHEDAPSLEQIEMTLLATKRVLNR